MAGGRYDGGHVLVLHTEDNTFIYAVPPEVIMLLEGMLPDDQYRALLSRPPRCPPWPVASAPEHRRVHDPPVPALTAHRIAAPQSSGHGRE